MNSCHGIDLLALYIQLIILKRNINITLAQSYLIIITIPRVTYVLFFKTRPMRGDAKGGSPTLREDYDLDNKGTIFVPPS